MTLPERHRSLGEQLRAHRIKLSEAQGVVATLQTQCAQLEGALALCKALIDEQPNGPDLGAETSPDA